MKSFLSLVLILSSALVLVYTDVSNWDGLRDLSVEYEVSGEHDEDMDAKKYFNDEEYEEEEEDSEEIREFLAKKRIGWGKPIPDCPKDTPIQKSRETCTKRDLFKCRSGVSKNDDCKDREMACLCDIGGLSECCNPCMEGDKYCIHRLIRWGRKIENFKDKAKELGGDVLEQLKSLGKIEAKGGCNDTWMGASCYLEYKASAIVESKNLETCIPVPWTPLIGCFGAQDISAQKVENVPTVGFNLTSRWILSMLQPEFNFHRFDFKLKDNNLANAIITKPRPKD